MVIHKEVAWQAIQIALKHDMIQYYYKCWLSAGVVVQGITPGVYIMENLTA